MDETGRKPKSTILGGSKLRKLQRDHARLATNREEAKRATDLKMVNTFISIDHQPCAQPINPGVVERKEKLSGIHAPLPLRAIDNFGCVCTCHAFRMTFQHSNMAT
jgi:hypothetical protein